MRKGGIEWFPIPMANIYIRDYYLHYTNFLKLSIKKSVIVNLVITDHTLRKKGEIQTMLIVTRLSSSLVPKMQLELDK